MNCYNHPERETELTCAACAKPVCPECKVALQGKIYCHPCAERMYVAALHRKEPGWFEKHLNLSFALALVASVIIVVIASTVIVAVEPEISDESLIGITNLIGYGTTLVVQFPVAAWVIRKKARNPWNILWLLLPFGFVMVFLLSNMSGVKNKNLKSPLIS
jgi:hypothetical protein